jgi:hypothetical protein
MGHNLDIQQVPRGLNFALFKPRLVLLVGFLAVFLYAVVDLRLVFEERDGLFLWNLRYFTDFIGRPGSLLNWADSLLVQLCHYNWPAALALAGAAWLLLISTVGLMNATARVAGTQLDTAPGAPVSDPAGIEKHPETRRIGDRRSATPVKSGAVSSCARAAVNGTWLIPGIALFALYGGYSAHTSLLLGAALPWRRRMAGSGWRLQVSPGCILAPSLLPLPAQAGRCPSPIGWERVARRAG